MQLLLVFVVCYNSQMPVKKTRNQSKTRITTEPKSMPEPLISEPNVGRLRRPKFFIALLIIVLAVAAFYLKGLFVAALVNGEPITRIQVISELEKQGGKQSLASLVNQALILQEAKKKNIQVSQSEIEASLKQIEDSLKGQGQNLDTALAAQGMTKQDLQEQLKLRNIVEKLLADKIKVTDKEITDYIEKNKDTFPTAMKEDEVKKSVGEQLKQQKMSSVSSAWLQELNKNAKINYFVSY
jgi:parvulin-like peptidyl-prolyl isomerase